ncbi:MAG: hypothetical protein HGA54_00570 [Actinobacteria bacterium]|nr:hypothetical protein [Actinomycetota bacterium]
MVSHEVQDEERIEKSNKSRRKLIVVIVFCFALAILLIAGALYYIKQSSTPKTEVTNAPITAVDDAVEDAATVTTKVPALTSFIGKTTDEVLASLGSVATLMSVSAVTPDASNPTITQLADITIAADSTGDGSNVAKVTTSTKNPAELYLSLDAAGKVVKAYYRVSLDALGNTSTSFETVLSDMDFIGSALKGAGVVVNDLALVLPEPAQYQTVATDTTGAQKISKEQYTYTGATNLTSAPTVWEVTLSFDYSITAATGDSGDASRMMYINIY